MSTFFYVDQPYWEEYAAHGGQRTWTAMIYLSAVESGGGTGFPLLDIQIDRPRAAFSSGNNMTADGSPNGWVLHSGKAVEPARNTLSRNWYREQRFS
jgi:prolyl 4-hydroxylase